MESHQHSWTTKDSLSFDYEYLFSRWATDLTTGILGFDCRRGLGIFLFTTASRTALGPPPTHPPIQWVAGDLSLGGKAAGAWSWPLKSIYCRGLRMSGAMLSLPQYALMAWCSVKSHGQLYLHLNTTKKYSDKYWRSVMMITMLRVMYVVFSYDVMSSRKGSSDPWIPLLSVIYTKWATPNDIFNSLSNCCILFSSGYTKFCRIVKNTSYIVEVVLHQVRAAWQDRLQVFDEHNF
jgi:hypothetical protein